MKTLLRRCTALLLVFCLLSACAPQTAATTMHLIRTEGSVAVADEAGKDLAVKDDLGLFSGYQVDTAFDSFAWINLDDVKLTKMDQLSRISILKSSRALEINIEIGSLLFNVTEPLEEDETMTIRSSSMMVGIRGTCGWVSVPDRNHMDVYLIEGTVACVVTQPDGKVTSAQISGGEAAHLSLSDDGVADITVEPYTTADVASFVQAEIREDTLPSSPTPAPDGSDQPPENPDDTLQWGSLLSGIAYHGDPAACRMTAQQAAIYANILQSEIGRSQSNFAAQQAQSSYYADGNFTLRTYAGLVDLGTGIPALMYGSALENHSEYGDFLEWPGTENSTVWAIWQFEGDQAVKVLETERTKVYAGHLYTGGHYVADPGLEASVYPFVNGQIASSPSTSAMERFEWDMGGQAHPDERVIDGQAASAAQLDAWVSQWDPDNSLAGFDHGSDVSVHFWGLSPAADVLNALGGTVPNLGGNTDPSQGTPTPETPATPEPPARNGLVSTYDPATNIRRTTLDTTGYPLSVCYEIPVFAETTDGYRVINAFFQAMEDEFCAKDYSEAKAMSLDNPYDETFYDETDADILYKNNKLVCVGIFNGFHMGGPHPYSTSEFYTFRTDTGEQIYLSDVVNASPEDIQTFLLEALAAQNNLDYAEQINIDFFRDYDADDYSFYIEDGKVIVFFDQYEGVSYAYGYIEPIEMPMGLKPEWQ